MQVEVEVDQDHLQVLQYLHQPEEMVEEELEEVVLVLEQQEQLIQEVEEVEVEEILLHQVLTADQE